MTILATGNMRCKFQHSKTGGMYQYGGATDVLLKTPPMIVLLQLSIYFSIEIDDCVKCNQNYRGERFTVLHNQPCMSLVFVYCILGRTNNWYSTVINTLQIKLKNLVRLMND